MSEPRRLLLTWSDAGVVGPRPAHQAPRPASDRGPVLRLLDQPESRYDLVRVLSVPAGATPARGLLAGIREAGPEAELHVLDVRDPSDYVALFEALGKLSAELRRLHPRSSWQSDILLSAGTPQAQTIWVLLAQAGLLPARMLQIVPEVFVPKGRSPVREVRLDFEGFPEIRALRRELTRLRGQLHGEPELLLGDSPPMAELRSRIARIASSSAPVLILGETGTGKELVARSLHERSARARGPFVAENCSVFAEGVLASELFGHEAGAFSGAAARHKGVFEQAHRGTLLLDEVGELSPRVQSALLRVLQEGSFRRVGGEARVSVDVRVLAATHEDLPRLVREGRFREDLYFRLRGATIDVPPLRARLGDIELLVDSFLDEVARRRDTPRLRVTSAAMRSLLAYPWPGNVRELRAEVERWSVFCDAVVDLGDLGREIREGPSATPPIASGAASPARSTPQGSNTLAELVADTERQAIAAALEAYDHNLSATARALDIDRNTLKRKMGVWKLKRRR
jgi:two-component system, NtrC family, response regulator AtoC